LPHQSRSIYNAIAATASFKRAKVQSLTEMLSAPSLLNATTAFENQHGREIFLRKIFGRMKKEVTEALRAWNEGDREALDKLMPLVYDELRRAAHRYMRRESEDHTLQTTALVHEAYLRLVDQRQTEWKSRAHFFGVAAEMMRRVLVDYARANTRAKRGGKALHISLDQAANFVKDKDLDLLRLDEALNELAKIDARRSRVVELRFFGGLDQKETAEVLGVSPATVLRDWNMAKAWLYRYMNG
jgi:RNA polymerase sigma factor (TIGR02999 family)